MSQTSEQMVPQHTDGSGRVQHGVHVECQRDAEFVVSGCGIALGWDERHERDGYPLCEPCWTTPRCPVCGCRLKGRA